MHACLIKAVNKGQYVGRQVVFLFLVRKVACGHLIRPDGIVQLRVFKRQLNLYLP